MLVLDAQSMKMVSACTRLPELSDVGIIGNFIDPNTKKGDEVKSLTI